MALPLEDYALIGNTETAALVGRDGSIDWMCAPRFDSPAAFAALLGQLDNGRWLICPTTQDPPDARAERRYRGDTLILETRFRTATGQVALVDFMPMAERGQHAELIRLVIGEAGSVDMRMELAPRFDYGHSIPWMRRSADRPSAVAGPLSATLIAAPPVTVTNNRWHAQFTVAAGCREIFHLAWHPSDAPPPPARDAQQCLAETEEFWGSWAARCSYHGRWRDPVLRSLITLKALTHRQTGGIVAAPTTSLPETIGGTRNWDYRYCWLRDSTFTLFALLSSGYREEAEAWREWLLRSVAGQPSQLQIMYGLAGERRLEEHPLPWLDGYEGSHPVRTGNDAHRQSQLDIFGEVMDSLYVARKSGVEAEAEAWEVQKAFLDFLEGHWREPDEGIWEVRGGARMFTHSRVMAWVAMDRAVKTVERMGQTGPVERWRRLRSRIRNDVLQHGYDSEQGTFVQYYGGSELDAALLLIPLVGFLPANDPRVVRTVKAIEQRLTTDGLVRRYVDDPELEGLPPGDSAFIACSFWLIDNLAMQGRGDEAYANFHRLLDLRNDVGLLSEEYDVDRRRLVGNFPQAFSHVALINSAHNLDMAAGPAMQRSAA